MQTLPNGVRGLVKAAGGSDVVNIQVWVRAGSRYESDRESGAAHLLEILALRGSKTYPAARGGDDDNGGAAGALRALGGEAGSLSSRDSTFFSTTVAAPYAARALQILADAVARPDLSDAAIEDAKMRASDDIARRAFDPVASASDLAYATAFSRHPYRRSALGSDASVASLSPAAVRDYFRKHYVGANVSVVVVGQIPTAQAQKLIAQDFAPLSAAKLPALKLATEAPLKTDVVARRRPVGREVIDLAWRSPGINKPDDCVAIDVLLALWSEGADANLRTLLMRDGENGPRQPLADAFDVDFLTQRDAGLFIISLTGPSDRDGAVNAVLGELKRVRDGGVSASELQRAKTQLTQQYIEQGENVAGQGGSLGFYDMISSYRFALEYLDRIARITNADLQRVTKQYLAPDRYLRAEILPLPRPRPDTEGESPVITAGWNRNR